MMSSDGFVPLQDRVFLDSVERKSMAVSSMSGTSSEPKVPPDSPGSSVSSRLQEEYDELLRYAVVVPSYPHLPSLTATASTSSGPVIHPVQSTSTQSWVTGGVHIVASTEAGSISAQTAGIDVITVGRPMQPRTYVESSTSSRSSVHESTLNSEDEERPDGRSNLVELPVSSSVDQPLPSLSQPRVASPVFTQPHQTVNSVFGDQAMVDHDISRMENLLDQWTTELKKNVMSEFSQAKIRLIEQHRQQMLVEKQRHIGEGTKLQNDMEALRELLATYEQSIQRKDQVISNLTAGLQHHRNRMEVQRSFTEWKVKHNDAKREAFASNLARKHYHHKLEQKVWAAWHSVVESRWQQRVEKACQTRAEQVCIELTNDYETKLASLNEALESARQEVRRLHQERDHYEEAMKKAFMRGVCALNLEAMTMFQEPEGKNDVVPGDHARTSSHADTDSEGGQVTDTAAGESEAWLGHPVTVQQEFIYSSEPTAAPPPRVVASHIPSSSVRGPSAQPSHVTAQPRSVGVGRSKQFGRGAKVLSTKVTGRSDAKRSTSLPTSAQTLVPPMTSVVVERHQPINKQTIGQAVAAKYPQPSNSTVLSVVHRKIAGQQTVIPGANIQTVKVVD